MKKLILTTVIVLIAGKSMFAQTSVSAKADTAQQLQNSMYFELAGTSLLGVTFNYERFLSKKPGGLSVHAGFGGGMIPGIFDQNDQPFGAIPLGVSYNIPLSSDKHEFLEMGTNYTFILGGADYSDKILSGVLSWRHLAGDGKMQIRVSVMPWVRSTVEESNLGFLWFGFSIGRRF